MSVLQPIQRQMGKLAAIAVGRTYALDLETAQAIHVSYWVDIFEAWQATT